MKCIFYIALLSVATALLGRGSAASEELQAASDAPALARLSQDVDRVPQEQRGPENVSGEVCLRHEQPGDQPASRPGGMVGWRGSPGCGSTAKLCQAVLSLPIHAACSHSHCPACCAPPGPQEELRQAEAEPQAC